MACGDPIYYCGICDKSYIGYGCPLHSNTASKFHYAPSTNEKFEKLEQEIEKLKKFVGYEESEDEDG